MSRRNTRLSGIAILTFSAIVGGKTLAAQVRSEPNWYPIGNTLQLLSLPSPASGPVSRVWYSPNGEQLSFQLPDGRVFESSDFESWNPTDEAPPPVPQREPLAGLEPQLMARFTSRDTQWAAGNNLWRTTDERRTWSNVTGYRGVSILGGPVLDVAVSPSNSQRVVAATTTGLWISHDGGMTWAGLNELIENLPATRLIAPPEGPNGLRIAVESGGTLRELEWMPGQRAGWVSRESPPLEVVLRRELSATFDSPVSAAAVNGEGVYAGSETGQLWASIDGGQTWRSARFSGGSVAKLWLDPDDSRFALAVLSGHDGGEQRVLRTLNGGIFWDDLTANLPNVELRGITADRSSGAIYIATRSGIYVTIADLRAPAPSTTWTLLPGEFAAVAVRDVMLDPQGIRLYAALDYRGVFVTPAPHRARNPLTVHSADYSARAAAPGALLSVVGQHVDAAAAGNISAPVLSATAHESQIQIPFETAGNTVQLRLSSQGASASIGLPLRQASPAILIDRDGTPLLLNAETGVQLDAMNPARGGMRVQVLVSGLGRVTPEWPTGLPGPLENAPRVINPVRVYFDGMPLPVSKAILAAGYIGYYIVETTLPDFVDPGASELFIEAAGSASNRVRVYVDH